MILEPLEIQILNDIVAWQDYLRKDCPRSQLRHQWHSECQAARRRIADLKEQFLSKALALAGARVDGGGGRVDEVQEAAGAGCEMAGGLGAGSMKEVAA